MLNNFFRTAFRNLWKHKIYSLLNILGLTVGLTAAFLVYLYVHFELSYDRFNTKADRIYRLVCDIKTPTETINTGVTSAPMAVNIKSDFPEVDAFVRVSGASLLVRKGDIKFQEEHSAFADSSLFRVFDFPLIHGDPATALREPLSIVLSETAARKYFGSSDPVGQTVLLTDGNLNATITGVMKDIPENSQIKADMFVSMSSNKRFDSTMDKQWSNFGWTSYLMLKPNTNAQNLQAKLPAFLQQRDGDAMKKDQMFFTLFLEPLKEVYLKSTRDGLERGSMNNVYVFSIIGIFILLIACINFINLTTARSTERAREVGIRKVAGAERSQLTRQFLGESVLLCFLAFVLSCILLLPVFHVLPLFNQLSGKEISNGIFYHLDRLGLLLIVALGIGVLAGIYPALVLSSFQPIKVLKGRFATGTSGLLLRKGLVVLQFTISIAIIIATLVVYRQLHYMRNQDLGFSNTQTLVLDTHGDNHRKALMEDLGSIRGVLGTTMSSTVPGGGNPGAYSMIQNRKGDMQIANLDLYFVDYDYIPQYKMKILAGRAFSRQFATDTTKSMILNESAVRLFGYTSPQEAVGRRFDQWGRQGVIIGVVKDFHFRSLHEAIKPLSMRIEPDGCDQISAKVSSANLPATIAQIESKWKKAIPYRPFSYYFADEFFDRQYRAEDRFGRLFVYFAILTVFISCLGLLGLASYSTLQRTKEIGIRKVMGASVTGIVNLLSREFLQLVLVSFLIATPIAWFLMDRWLKDFAYRIDISWWIFAMSGLLALLIALFTISFQAIRAAVSNPIIALRSE